MVPHSRCSWTARRSWSSPRKWSGSMCRTSGSTRSFGAIRQSVAEAHELDVFAIVLLSRGSIPKTASAKIQRQACRTFYLHGGPQVVGSWVAAARQRDPRPAWLGTSRDGQPSHTATSSTCYERTPCRLRADPGRCGELSEGRRPDRLAPVLCFGTDQLPIDGRASVHSPPCHPGSGKPGYPGPAGAQVSWRPRASVQRLASRPRADRGHRSESGCGCLPPQHQRPASDSVPREAGVA